MKPGDMIEIRNQKKDGAESTIAELVSTTEESVNVIIHGVGGMFTFSKEYVVGVIKACKRES